MTDPFTGRIERALDAVITQAAAGDAPLGLSAALRHAVFPGGARIRPRLCLAVAAAFGDPAPALSDAAAAAIELLHCASLVHDDLPCFDDAWTRRGRPAVHRAFGEPLAVLAGDALIALAFEVLARAPCPVSERLARVVTTIARSIAPPQGIVAGQGWELEPVIPVVTYRRAKTGALFEAAAVAGAITAGHDSSAIRRFGQLFGEAYQIADDIRDVAGDPAEIGKAVGRDAQLGRPNAANDLGLRGSRQLLEQLLRDSLVELPSACQRDALRVWVIDAATAMIRVRRASREVEATGTS